MAQIVRAARAAAILLAAAMALYALFLLLVGMPGMAVSESPLTETARKAPGAVRMAYAAYPGAFVPLVAAALLLGGLLTRKLVFAWIGLAVLAVFAVLFLFSAGWGLLPVAGLLLILLIVIQRAQNRRVE